MKKEFYWVGDKVSRGDKINCYTGPCEVPNAVRLDYCALPSALAGLPYNVESYTLSERTVILSLCRALFCEESHVASNVMYTVTLFSELFDHDMAFLHNTVRDIKTNYCTF